MFFICLSAARRSYMFRSYSSASDLNSQFDFLHLLQLSSNNRSLELTTQSHARIISSGSTQNPFVATKLISAYAAIGCLTESRFVFDSVPVKSAFFWNCLINGYVKNQKYNKAFRLFHEMCSGNVPPDDFTLATVSKASGGIRNLIAGRLVHGKSIRIGFVLDTVVANSLMSMYCACGEFEESRKLFDEMPHRNVNSWNVLISGYADLCNGIFNKHLLEILDEMKIAGVEPNGFTISSILTLCGGDVGRFDYGRELHCYIVKKESELGVSSDAHLGCCLIDMYSKSNKVAVSRRIFNRMPRKNVFVWTSMINGYVRNGFFNASFVLFREMQVEDGIEPNKVSLVSILPACATFAGLTGGKQIHGFIYRKHLNTDTTLCNALVDMYAKCGNLSSARQIFEVGFVCRDAISWSTMISGYGSHGMAEEAVALFHEMLKTGITPDMITTVCVLSACCKSGLTEQGLDIYDLVTNKHRVNPTHEICACIVDILGRAGKLDEALAFINKMAIEAGPSIWGALVNAAVLHGNSDMQELAYRFLLRLEPENASNYVSLSNRYAAAERWDAVADLRTVMKDKRLKKTPGCSWISINGGTHCFLVSDKSHPCSDPIYVVLGDLQSVMAVADYNNDFQNLTVS